MTRSLITAKTIKDLLVAKRAHAMKLGFENVEFIESDIENMHISNNIIDVVISNCVLNLVPDKGRAFEEIFRILKNKGRFCVSDVVITCDLPESLKNDAEMYAGCVAGAINKHDYIGYIRKQGFEEIEIKKEKKIIIPDSILSKYMGENELDVFKSSNTGIISITVIGRKP